MFTVGITGGIATGKSTATDFFAKKGIDIIDADEISRNLQEKGQVGYEAIVKKYGSKVLANNEELDRGKLREIAFKNKADKKFGISGLITIKQNKVGDFGKKEKESSRKPNLFFLLL